MEIVKWDELMAGTAWTEPSAVTIGVFDGVHRGHRALIDRITASPYRSVVVSFSVSPRRVFHKGSYPGDIVSLERKLELFAEAGAASCVLIDFSDDFSRMSGSTFFRRLARTVNMRYCVVGADFHCGYRNDTDAAAIARLSADAGIRAEIVPPVTEGGLPVSSSRIRHAIAAGDYSLAASMLGRNIERL